MFLSKATENETNREVWLLTIGVFDQSDEKTWPDQQKDNKKDKDNDKWQIHLEPSMSDLWDFGLWDIWPEWWENMTWPTNKKEWERQWRWQIHLENTPQKGF